MTKLKIGWFSFSCCEDSTIVFVEMMNENYFKWKELLEFRHVNVLKSNNTLSDIDVSFVEGAIASDKDEQKLKDIRANSKKLVAIGSCAVKGNPSSQRNDFDEKRKEEIMPHMIRWGLNQKVKTLKECVQVDDEVDGCPMSEEVFLTVLNKYLKEFGVIDAQH
jgi:coenzyme F420-reducing hydrogenase gamma subunit